ncbi:hypothetical protein BKI52_29170 [marine bacterium AO1-C]|nr:hypothetical protein BKI52_29170 [marine bacterium AO1-C]
MRYFWWVFPFTSLASWLLSLSLMGKRIPLAERIQLFKQQQEKSDNNQPLKVLIVIAVIIIALYNFLLISKHASTSSYKFLSLVVGSIISIGLIIWYLNHHSGIWPVLIIAAVQIGIMSYVASPRGNSTISPNFVYNLANVLLLFPLFHLYHLKNIAEPPPEQVESEGEGLQEDL